jgi:hypothetical protein
VKVAKGILDRILSLLILVHARPLGAFVWGKNATGSVKHNAGIPLFIFSARKASTERMNWPINSITRQIAL